MVFNEDSRVKIPTILHLMRLGYEYLFLKDPKVVWDDSTNIFTDIFHQSLKRINPDLSDLEAKLCFDEVSLCLENEDLGKAFYEKLTNKSGTRLIDFEDFNNNTFNVVTELTYKKDDEEFRPDIILLINGLPLVFIEVKKPNNKDGILAEHKRIQTRFQNKKFRNQKTSFEPSRRHGGEMKAGNERFLILKDVLVNSTGVGTLGRVAFIKRLEEEKTTCDSHVTIVRASPQLINKTLLAWQMLRLQPIIEKSAQGSTGQVELNKSYLEDLNIIVPTKGIQDEFSNFVSPIEGRISNNEVESQRLVKL